MTDAIPSFRRAILYRICFCLGLSELTLPIGLPPLFTSEEDFEEGDWNVRVELEDEDEPVEDNVEEDECDKEEVLDLEGEVIFDDVSGRFMESEVISSLFLHSC